MESLLIHTESKEELSLLIKLASKMGFKSEILTSEDKLDIGLSKAISENDSSDTLNFAEAMEYYKTLDKAK
jgi:hypothetical protein